MEDSLNFKVYIKYNATYEQEILQKGDFWLKFENETRRIWGKPEPSDINNNETGFY